MPERKAATVRIKHLTPYRPQQQPPAQITWVEKLLAHTRPQPRDSPMAA